MTAHAPIGTVDGIGDTRTARLERVLRHPPEAVWDALTTNASLEPLVHARDDRAVRGRRRVVRPGRGARDRHRDRLGPSPRARVPLALPRRRRRARHLDARAARRRRRDTPRVVHTALPVDWAVGYGSGWHSYLDRLAAHLAGQRPPDWAERMAEVRPLYGGA